ncbi:MAG: type VI secretion system protein TssR domain-containing protein [Chitinophagales bacterium]
MKQQYKLLCSIFILFSIAGFSIQAQEVMYLKQEFQRPLENKVVNSNGENINYSMPLGTREGTGKSWIVFSDRNNNKTYEEADITSNPKISNIKFMERFFVIDEKDEYVKIAQGTTGIDGIEIGNVYGWIPKANLLLWTHCIYNDDEITKKALVLNNIDMMKERGKIDTAKLAKFYAHPDMAKKDFLLESRLFKVYYVYKVLPDAVLVGKRKSFETTKNQSAMLGWSSPKKITFWDSRVCVEHNSKVDAVEERGKQNDEYIVFDTEDAAKVYANGSTPSSKHIIMKIKDYEYDRRMGNIIRFPILSKDTPENVLKVCAIGEVVNETGTVDQKDLEKAIKKLQKTLKDVETVNMLFVVDGTEGMKPFLKKISTAIDVATKSLKNDGQDIKMGAVVYRNKNAGKKQQVEVKSLRKPADISKYISNIKTDVPFEAEESLIYEGIKTAMENAGLKRKQTNIVMVIGREGSADDDLEKDIIEMVAAKNCHIMAMQVDNKDSDIYDDFIYQFQDIILSAAETRYKKYDQADGGTWKPRFDEAYTGGSEHRKYKLKNTSAIGTLIYPSAGRQISADELQNEIIDVIKNMERNVAQYVKRLNNMIEGTGTGDTQYEKFDPAVSLLLDDLTKGEMNAVSEENFQGSKVGYIVLQRNNNSKYKLYEYALFLGNDELSETTKTLKSFAKPDLTHEALLTLIENTWRTILRKYEGVDINDYADLSLSQIHEKVFGLPVQSSFLNTIKLKEIKDMNKEVANEYIQVLSDSHSGLNGILMSGAGYDCAFKNDNDIYYWILERELP